MYIKNILNVLVMINFQFNLIVYYNKLINEVFNCYHFIDKYIIIRVLRRKV